MNNDTIKQYLEYLKLSGIQDIFINPKKQINKAELLQELEKKYCNCKKCELHTGRHKFVYGNGNADARLMIIGEGPGAEENRLGKVFVGRSGQLLTKMLNAINLSREEIYISNIVKCRPPGNRNPLPEEKKACLPYLDEQISIIQPELILLVGKVAAVTLLEIDQTLKAFRERTYTFRGIKTYVSYHPSALLRNPHWKKFAWIDLQKLQKDYLAL
ncbi:MAG: uracil-DNA glycosylase [Candidatus Tenebribacter davisii]|nr:uracil-DNA glycosylase [Candidatus Tenebribacter davisii]